MTGAKESERIAERFEMIVKPVLEGKDLGLIKTEYVNESGNWFLRAYINKKDGSDISINDCAYVSRIVSKKLDKADYIDDVYTMEICSAGFIDAPQTEPDPDIPDDDLG